MLAFPNAKINLGLNVTGTRNDGYHDLETVLFPIAFRDVLEIVPLEGDEPAFQSTGLAIPGKQEENLCLKAYRLLKAERLFPAVKMHLHKVIPMGAGLGGGSSDAAFAIKLLNELFALGLTPNQMKHFAGILGSDCAFFIENKAVYACGRGDQFEPVTISLAGYTLMVIIPPVHVSTPEAYRHVKLKKPAENIRVILEADPREWKNRLVNDFEESVFPQFPEILQIKEKLYDAGAVYASMSGSGSAVYGLFDHDPPKPDHFRDH
ncbi:MAG: 4-(cytidine 5'-diphospho)-2-C-methyl-D-erythritol kinase, partial [Bacteroidetes bacterium]|nr:4-(cytidine 5'-diphospho)-2-C-methyl-D-erythritol kinase [Bacteroidota bacterium]